jgi:hypothetical protein
MSDSFLLMKYLTSLGAILAHVTLYGYIELKWFVNLLSPQFFPTSFFFRQCGYLFTFLIALYLLYQRKSFLPIILSSCGYLLSSYHHTKLSYAFFFMIEFLYFFGSQPKEIDHEIIQFKPYEREIRQYLLKKDPSLLHKVDNLLVKYSGREEELMQKLRSKYEITSHSNSTTVVQSKPETQVESHEPTAIPVQSSTRSNTAPGSSHLSDSIKFWGTFDSAISPKPSLATSHQTNASPFSSPTTHPSSLPPQQSSFSFFSPPPHARAPHLQQSQQVQQSRKSGQYGALDFNEDEDGEDDSPSSLTGVQRGITRAPYANHPSHSEYKPHTQQQPHQEHEVLFHAQTNEVVEAKRKAKEAMQHRINQRLHHH